MGKVCTRAKWSIQPELLALDEMPLHRALHRHKHKRGAIRRLRPPLSREGRRSYIVNNWLSIHRTIIKSLSWRLRKISLARWAYGILLPTLKANLTCSTSSILGIHRHNWKIYFSDAEIFNGPNFDTLDFIRPLKNLSTQIFISLPTLR